MKYAQILLAVTSAVLATPLVSWGQPAENAAIAEALFQEAKQLISEGRVSEACSKFVESDRLDPGLGTKLHIADCYERDGKLATAWAAFIDIIPLAQKSNDPRRVELAKGRADALAPRVPKLKITLAGADPKTVEVLRDGLRLGPATYGTPLPIDPGDHLIVARSPGFRDWSLQMSIPEGATLEVKVPALEVVTRAPTPSTPSPSNGLRTGGFVALGVGAAGIVMSGVMGALAMQKMSAVDENCPNNDCQGQQVYIDMWSEVPTFANISTVAGGVGLAGIAAGTVMLVMSRRGGEKLPAKSRAQVVVEAWPSGTWFGVKGVFQ